MVCSGWHRGYEPQLRCAGGVAAVSLAGWVTSLILGAMWTFCPLVLAFPHVSGQCVRLFLPL